MARGLAAAATRRKRSLIVVSGGFFVICSQMGKAENLQPQSFRECISAKPHPRNHSSAKTTGGHPSIAGFRRPIILAQLRARLIAPDDREERFRSGNAHRPWKPCSV